MTLGQFIAVGMVAAPMGLTALALVVAVVPGQSGASGAAEVLADLAVER